MNDETVRRWYAIFKGGNELVEVRAIKGRNIYSGYFTDVDTMISEMVKYDKVCNMYFTVNRIKKACYSREQRDRMLASSVTTSDNDIERRIWCLIDVDVRKPADTNSTDAEKAESLKVTRRVYTYLRDEGFEDPVVCDSANGYHLMYRMDEANSDDVKAVMSSFLQVLDMYFSNEVVEIDKATFNAARVCKLYGTSSRKGMSTEDRPQRESKILNVPDEIKVTPLAFFRKVADALPRHDASDYRSTGSFSIDDFISKHGIRVSGETFSGGVRRIRLEECPFDSNHKSPDSALFVMPNGAVGFKCFHNSCSQYTFKDFRMKYEPDAYSRKDLYEHHRKMDFYTPAERKREVQQETKEKGRKLLRMSDIEDIDYSKIESIPTGVKEIDERLRGLLLGEVTIVSGINGSGKSTWLNMLALNAVQAERKTVIWSGELPANRLKSWIFQAAAGKGYLDYRNGVYSAGKRYIGKIEQWLDPRLFIYNNDYGNDYGQIISDIRTFNEKGDIRLFILDNMMAMDLSALSGDKYEQQKAFILGVKALAKETNSHVVIVAHPRKETTLLRKEGVCGTSDLTNAVDNVLLIHRVNTDFIRKAEEFWKHDKVAVLSEFDNVIEVAKNRDFGHEFVTGMYFEADSRRFINDRAEVIRYRWNDTEQVTMGFDVDGHPDNRIEPNRNFDTYGDPDKFGLPY